MQGVPGWEQPSFCAIQDAGIQVQSIRMNAQKLQPVHLAALPVESQVPWSAVGFYLTERPVYTLDPLLHAGAYYVQEASSMFLEQAVLQHVEQKKGILALDLCAAPGGKSTHLLSLLPPDAVLVSNEVIKSRVGVLEENLIKWGNANKIITNSDPREFGKNTSQFDLIVIDAPCSGSGMFRRDAHAISEWSPDLVNLCQQRQQRILTDAWNALQPDGILIYSTCSYSMAENEDMIDWIMDQWSTVSLPIALQAEWGIVETRSARHNGYGYRCYPNRLKGEGFFLTALKKIEGAALPSGKPKAPKWEKPAKQILQAMPNWVNLNGAELVQLNEQLVALPENVMTAIQQLGSVYIKSAGITLGKWMGKNLVPDHALAVSNMVANVVPKLELSYQQALHYLRKDDVAPASEATGWQLLTYKGVSLGWAKLLGNRANNYYPKEWRIRMQVPPESAS